MNELAQLLRPDKLLAIVGGAVVGGLLLGAIAGTATKRLTTRPMPGWAKMFVRGLGGLAAGWLVALWLMGTGGGLGGQGGTHFTEGNGKPDPKKDEKTAKDDKKGAATKPGDVLRVRVLTKEEVQDRLKDKFDYARCYWVLDTPQAEVLTLQQVKGVLEKRTKDSPPLKRLDVVSPPRSPHKDLPIVSDLEKAAKELGLEVEYPPR